MAVDTKDKRASATGLPWMPIMPAPGGTLDAQDRQQVSGIYRGIAAGSGVTRRKQTGLLLGAY